MLTKGYLNHFLNQWFFLTFSMLLPPKIIGCMHRRRFFLKKANSRGAKILIQTLCSMYPISGVPEKINHFLLSIFSVIINSKLLKFYTPGTAGAKAVDLGGPNVY